MGRRKKKKSQIFSTSLLDMLFCAFGGMYTLFVIGAALFTTVSISLPVLVTAQLDFNRIATLEDYKANSYLAFGVDGNYVNETKSDTSITVHYGYVESQSSELESRKTYLFLKNGIGGDINSSIDLYAENLELPLWKKIERESEENIRIHLEMFIQGQQYINDTSSFRIALKELYENQLPSKKHPIMTPLLNLQLTIENEQLQFKK